MMTTRGTLNLLAQTTQQRSGLLLAKSMHQHPVPPHNHTPSVIGALCHVQGFSTRTPRPNPTLGSRWKKLSSRHPRASPWAVVALVGMIGASATVAMYHWTSRRQQTQQQRQRQQQMQFNHHYQQQQQQELTFVPLDMIIRTVEDSLENGIPMQQQQQQTLGMENMMYHLSSAVACKGKSSDTISTIGPNNLGHHASEEEIDNCICGEDSFFFITSKRFSAIGVADGVGGWTNMGVDPKEFSDRLMKNCFNEFNAFETEYNNVIEQNDGFGLAKSLTADVLPPSALDVLSTAYWKIHLENQVDAGSSTACIIALDGQKRTLNFANVGDSAFMIIRDGKIAIRSKEQQHSFNAPFQLGIIPQRMRSSGSLDNKPSDADTAKNAHIVIKEGDFIIMGTDGLFDNVYDQEILSILSSSNNDLQYIARHLVEYTSSCVASNRDGPFARNARTNGYFYSGAKPDDVTVIVARVDSHKHAPRFGGFTLQNDIDSAF